MRIIEDIKKVIKDIIKANDIGRLKKYFEKNNKIISNDFNEILIEAIENNASLEIVKFIYDKRIDKNLNYIDNRNSYSEKVPLFIAIGKNNFEVADFLIKKGAKLDYNIDHHYIKLYILIYLGKYNLFNRHNLKYIIDKNIDKNKKFDYNYIINELIIKSNNDCIKFLFNYVKYNFNFIKCLLCIYKNLKTTKNLDLIEKFIKKFNYLAENQIKKISIEDKMYENAIKYNNNTALGILFENDDNDELTIVYRINNFNLNEKLLETNNYNIIKKILIYEPVNFKYINYEKILIFAFNNMEDKEDKEKNKIGKLLIKTFIYSSYYDDDIISYKNHSKWNNIVSNEFHEFEYESDWDEPNVSLNKYINLVLNIAIRKGNLSVIEYLVNSGEYDSDINEEDIYKNYPILVALESENCNKYKIFKYLLENGADCNLENNNGRNMLFIAIDKNDFYLVYLLTKFRRINGLCMNITDIDGSIPLSRAYNKDNLKIFNYLIRYMDINQKDSFGNNILYKLIDESDDELLKKIICMSIDIDIYSKNNLNKTILDYIILKKNYKILEFLLDNDKLDLNRENLDGKILLISLAENDKYVYGSLFEKLLMKGSNINKSDNNGNTALSFAVQNNNSTLFKLLITKISKKIINMKGKDGNTPLHLAVIKKNCEMVELLIKYGADKSIINNNGCSPSRLNQNNYRNSRFSFDNTEYNKINNLLY